jgi:hypothetical protein
MRVVADFASGDIIQVEKNPDIGSVRPFNGRFTVPIPEMVASTITDTSYVLPVDGGDVFSLAMAAMLVQFPMYTNILFNPLLTNTDIGDLDLTGTYLTDTTRAQVGRATGPLPTGQAPNMVAILNRNQYAVPAKPGLLVTDAVDITAMTGGFGADEFLLWWKLYDFDVTEDVTSEYGATVGLNDPAIKNITEIDSEPAGFQVYVSNDNGATWASAARMTPVSMALFGTQVRIAFRNVSNTKKRYLAAYSFMF